MGQALQAAQKIAEAFENHDFDSAFSLLADDFVFFDPSSPRGEMNAEQWLGSNANVVRAMPDFSYNFEVVGEDGNQVKVDFQMSGTHTADLDLSAMGMGVIPATGTEVMTDKGTSIGTVNSAGKIERIEIVDGTENTGFMGVMRQLGIG